MKNVLNSFNIFPSKFELYNILRRYDTNKDGLLDINEFSNMILPLGVENNFGNMSTNLLKNT